MSNNGYTKGDYILVQYDGDELTGKIKKIEGSMAGIEVCLSARRGEDLLTDEITTELSSLKRLGIKKN